MESVDEQLLQALKREFKTSLLQTMTSWVARDKSNLPADYMIRMTAGFIEAYELCNEIELNEAFRDRLMNYFKKILDIEKDYPNLA